MAENCFKELKTLNSEKITVCIMECLDEYCRKDEESQNEKEIVLKLYINHISAVYLHDGKICSKWQRLVVIGYSPVLIMSVFIH